MTLFLFENLRDLNIFTGKVILSQLYVIVLVYVLLFVVLLIATGGDMSKASQPTRAGFAMKKMEVRNMFRGLW